MKKILFFIIIFLFSFKIHAQKQIERVGYDVKHYTISLDLSNMNSREISGNCSIDIEKTKAELNKIELDLLGFKIDKILINNKKTENYTYNDTVISISLKSFKKKFNAVIFYHGIPAKDEKWGGFFRTSKYAFNYGVGMAAEPPTFGRAWFPCVDNFTDRATYDYFLTIPQNLTAVACGTLQETKLHPNKTKTVHWKLKNNIPTYISAIAVSDYIEIKDTYKGLKNDIPISIFVNKEDSLNATKSFKNLKSYIKIFEDRFGAYLWERVGYVTVPFFGGAMEHATNITLSKMTVDGSLDDETLYAHELAHHWFGNLVTCASEKDMWLNEGWASYCEAIFIEKQYGYNEFKEYNRGVHAEVLRFAHLRDEKYLPLYNVPHSKTYGKTIYDKGAGVVHTLRNYLGDNKFFKSIKNYLKTYAFSHATVENLKQSLSKNSKINLDDFFKNWVYTKGFTHFSVDSFHVKEKRKHTLTTVYLHQRLKETPEFFNKNKIEIYFISKNQERYKETVNFSGEYQKYKIKTPFMPVAVMLDLEEKITDATSDSYKTISKKGKYEFKHSFVETEIEEISDSAFVRVSHNWIAPTGYKQQQKGLYISNLRYWKIDAVLPKTFKAKAKFFYDYSTMRPEGYLDNGFIKGNDRNITLLYRPNASQDWEEVETTLKPRFQSGYIIVNELKAGEYALGIWEF